MAEPEHEELSQQHWFYRRGGRLHGPMTIRELRAAMALGFLGRDDLVRERVLGRWVPAAEVQCLQFPPAPHRGDPNSTGHAADPPQPEADE